MIAKKVGSLFAGIILIVAVVWLGIHAATDSSYVAWFGIASAVVAPLAFAIIGFGFRSDERQLFQQLSKIPQINDLIQQAVTQEEKIALLEQERARLNEIIQVEARRQTLVANLDSLEKDISRTLKDYNAISEELELINVKIEGSPALNEMKRIQERINARRKGKVIIIKMGKKELTISENKFSDHPVDVVILLVLRLIQRLQNRTANKLKLEV